eukprot:1109923-Rhodomonas_salina.1
MRTTPPASSTSRPSATYTPASPTRLSRCDGVCCVLFVDDWWHLGWEVGGGWWFAGLGAATKTAPNAAAAARAAPTDGRSGGRCWRSGWRILRGEGGGPALPLATPL